ncbi:hypothetical protein [Mediterraneibacter sp.]|jgi:hypothetical protein|uniref:hypothetical protein n=1 Tax=Mediterraneibacter sp. TaxID=2316022 RepID=UPI0027BAAC60|nr:hypothetical protein [Mediterraneibacter sp.]
MDKVRNGICKKSRSEKSHFKPFLNVRLGTPEQKQALRNILEYCDETTLKVPFIMGIGVKMAGGIIIRHLLPGEKCRKSSKIKDITIYSSPI